MMSLFIARFQSHGMNVIPFDVILARTQWLLVCFWRPQRQVNKVVAAISNLLSPSVVLPEYMCYVLHSCTRVAIFIATLNMPFYSTTYSNKPVSSLASSPTAFHGSVKTFSYSG